MGFISHFSSFLLNSFGFCPNMLTLISPFFRLKILKVYSIDKKNVHSK